MQNSMLEAQRARDEGCVKGRVRDEGAQEGRALWMLKMVITWHGTAGAEPSPQKDNMFNRKRIW